MSVWHVNCAKRVEEEKKCQFCNRTGHGVEACLWKLTIKGHARADGMVNMLRVMRATTLTPKDEATRKDKEWKDKVNQMRKLESWLEWFLDEGQRVFWIGCTTVVRNSPELVNELQAINTAIAYTVERLRGKVTIWKKAMSGTTTPNQYRKESRTSSRSSFVHGSSRPLDDGLQQNEAEQTKNQSVGGSVPSRQ